MYFDSLFRSEKTYAIISFCLLQRCNQVALKAKEYDFILYSEARNYYSKPQNIKSEAWNIHSEAWNMVWILFLRGR